MIRYAAPIGALKALPSTGIGKAFLGELSDDELAAYLSKIDLVQVTPSTIVNREQLLADVQRSRKRGYFVTRGENIPDVMAIARAFEMEGEHLAIAVAGPIHRLEPKISNIGQALISATAAIGQLGQTSKLAMK
jgi:DNA-binding IclR family transcriptional regulator